MQEQDLKNLQLELKKITNPKKAKILKRFFKTGKGEYGEGDLFLGITVPSQRTLAKKYSHFSLTTLQTLIKSKFHEERLISLLILTYKYPKVANQEKEKIYKFYLKNTKYINNWDLVDLSADKIVGAYLENKNKSILYKLAKSDSLWERRIAILSTFHFIKQGSPVAALKIAKILISDKHDLIHKAVGWMLREVGKRCGEKAEAGFLLKYYQVMPRTMLRYAIEKFSEKKRQFYLLKK